MIATLGVVTDATTFGLLLPPVWLLSIVLLNHITATPNLSLLMNPIDTAAAELPLSSLSSLPTDVIRIANTFSDLKRGQLMYQIKVPDSVLYSIVIYSFENDLFVTFSMPMEVLSVYRGGIFSVSIPKVRKFRKFKVCDGLICVLSGNITDNFEELFVYAPDGCLVNRYHLQRPKFNYLYPFLRGDEYPNFRVCSGVDKGGLSAAWKTGSVFHCQYYDSQSNILSSFDYQSKHISKSSEIDANFLWFDGNSNVVFRNNAAFETFNKFGVLISSIQSSPPETKYPITYFSLIGGKLHHFQYQTGSEDKDDNGVIISNQHESWHVKNINPWDNMQFGFSSGNCAKYEINNGIVTFDCFY